METLILHDYFLQPPPLIISFTLMFFSIYFSAYFIIFKNWNSSRFEASSCLMSLFHGIPAVLLALNSIPSRDLSQIQSTFFFFSENTVLQDTVLEFSIGYFIVDLSHYIFFVPTDFLFIAHHLATLYVLCTCRYVIHGGGISILLLLVLAEITSPCQNTWSLARFRKVDLPFAAAYYEFLSPFFFTFYSVVRGILAPFYVFKLMMMILKVFVNGGEEGKGLIIPIWALVSWMVVIVTAIGVSILWVMNHWVALYRRKSIEHKKVN